MDKTILQVDTKAVLNIIKDLEHQLSDYHRQDRAPAWAGVLETRIDQLEKFYKGVKLPDEHAQDESVTGAADPAVDGDADAPAVDADAPTGDASKPSQVDLETLATEDRIFNKLRHAMESKVATHQLSFESKVTSFALEVDRLHKLLEIRPTVSDMQELVTTVAESDKRTRDALTDLSGNLLKNTVKVAVNGEMKSITNQVATTKTINDAAIDLIKRTVNEYAVDISNIRVSTMNNFDNVVEPMLARLSATCADNQVQLTAASKDHYKEIGSLNKTLNERKADQDAMTVNFKNFEVALALKFAKLQEDLGNENQLLRDEVAESVRAMEATEEKNTKLEEALSELKAKLESDQIKNKSEVESLSMQLADEKVQRKLLQSMVDDIVGQSNDEKISKHDEQIQNLENAVADIKNKIMEFCDENGQELEKINVYINQSKSEKENIKAELGSINSKIEVLLEDDKMNKNRSELLHNKIKDMENSGLMSLKYRVETAEDNATTVKAEVVALAETLTKFIDAGQEATRKADELDERIDELENGISSRMNTNRDALMEVLLDVQNEMNMNLKNVRENIEAMAATEGNLENFQMRSPRSPRLMVDDASSHESYMETESQAEQEIVSDSDSSRPTKIRSPRSMDGALVQGSNFGAPAPGMKQPNKPRTVGYAMYSSGGGNGQMRRGGGPETMGNGGPLDQITNEVQFMSDLCINFEEISTKKKRAMAVPPSMCETVAEVTQALAEKFANIADLEMVKFVIVSMGSSSMPTKNDMKYDENFVINCRKQMVDEYIAATTTLVLVNNPQPGIIRLDARSMFLSLVSKSLNMFMTKHNQVLTIGNSRLGRIKIPSCIACDRPLLEKSSVVGDQQAQQQQQLMSLSLNDVSGNHNRSGDYGVDQPVNMSKGGQSNRQRTILSQSASAGGGKNDPIKMPNLRVYSN